MARGVNEALAVTFDCADGHEIVAATHGTLNVVSRSGKIWRSK